MCAIPALSKVSIQRSTRLKSYCTAPPASCALASVRSEEHTSELQSQSNLVCRLLLEKKNALLDARHEAAGGDVGPQGEEFVRVHRIPLDAVEEAQQPGRPGLEGSALLPARRHLRRTAHELVAAGPLHAVDAQVGPADADRVLGRPGACRVVLRGHQAVTGVEGSGHRGA